MALVQSNKIIGFINEKGEALGMINSKLSIENAQGVGFSIALRYIFAFAAQLRIKLKRSELV